MTARDMAAVAFKAMAAWLIVSGVVGVFSAALTWAPDVALYGKEAAIWRLAASAIYVPVGAIAWLVSDWASRLGFPAHAEPEAFGLTRADLYAFASVLVGLYLLADALPQVVYWIVIWRSSRGTGLLDASSSGNMDNWVHVRATIGAVAVKTVLGLVLLSGPERIKAGLVRLRRELSGDLAAPEADPSDGTGSPRDGV